MRAVLHTHSLCPHDKRIIELMLKYDLDYSIKRHDNQSSRTEIFDALGLIGMDRTLPKIAINFDDGTKLILNHEGLFRYLLNRQNK